MYEFVHGGLSTTPHWSRSADLPPGRPLLTPPRQLGGQYHGLCSQEQAIQTSTILPEYPTTRRTTDQGAKVRGHLITTSGPKPPQLKPAQCRGTPSTISLRSGQLHIEQWLWTTSLGLTTSPSTTPPGRAHQITSDHLTLIPGRQSLEHEWIQPTQKFHRDPPASYPSRPLAKSTPAEATPQSAPRQIKRAPERYQGKSTMGPTFRKIHTMRHKIRHSEKDLRIAYNRLNRNSSPLGPWSVLAPRAPPDYSEAPRAAYNATRSLNPR